MAESAITAPREEPVYGQGQVVEDRQQQVPVAEAQPVLSPPAAAPAAAPAAMPEPEQPTVIQNLMRVPFKSDQFLAKMGYNPTVAAREDQYTAWAMYQALAGAKGADPLTRVMSDSILKG